MEIPGVSVPVTEIQYLWQLICDPLAQPPTVSLISQCVVWMIIFYGYHRLKQFFQGKQREARQQQHLRDHSDIEPDNIEKLCLEVQTPTAASSAGSGAAQESLTLVPVSMCVDDSCGVDSFAGLSLKDAASQLRAPGEEVTFLQSSAGPVVQTKLTPLWAGDTANTFLATAKKGERFLVQLGRWRLFFRPSTGGEEVKMQKLAAVPVILHSSYSGGILTVEGLHLTQATIQTATKDKCITLETKYYAGSGGLEIFTSESGLPSKNLAEVFVLASKKIVVDGLELRVNSFAARIQNDNLRTVFRSILPFTILVIYATKQILVSVMGIMETATNTASVIAWLLPCIIVVSTQALPLRTETTIAVMLKKLAVRIYHTLYFAAQCFIPDKDPETSSMNEGVSTSEDQTILKPGKSSNSQCGKSAQSGDSGGDPPLNEEDSEAPHSSVMDPAWEWPVYDTIYNKRSGGQLKRREQSEDNMETSDQTEPFKVIYRNLKDLPWASQVKVTISSPFLIEVIKVLLPGKIDQSAICKKEVSLDGPELFQICEQLRDELTTAADSQEASNSEASSSDGSTSNGEKLLHLNHLLRFMDKEFQDIKLMSAAMKSIKKVSWEMLWAYFPPEERVVYLDDVTEEGLCGDVLETYYMNTHDGGLVFVLKVTNWDYNCRTWQEYSTILRVPKFKGEREFCNLDTVRPLRFADDPEAIIRKFREQGARFCELSMLERSCFMNYKGPMIIRYKAFDMMDLGICKENADGRVMIDLASFAKMNPGYPLGTAKPPSEVIRDSKVTTIDITRREDRIFAPAMVYGFSFRLKQWGSFSVSGFSNIIFNSSAFDDLVMDAETKDVVENLVRKQLDDGKDVDPQERERVDPIASKGKTLTAESLSEKLECPLWCLSVSELGTIPATIEVNLVKVMNIAASWGALLLLDEADVFLERRTASEVTRNAMTGLFLRLLEYYRGVLFLTTNRDCAFDEAMRSRISMFLHYEKHNEDQRRILWTNMFDRVGLKSSDDNLAEFTKADLNGREIRNVIKTAHTLSRSENNEAQLEIDDVRKALKVYEASTKVWARDHDKPAPERVPDGWRKIRRTFSDGILS